MGAGIAKGVAAPFPQALEADRQTPKGKRAKLGTCSFAEIETPHGRLTVVNAYTQFHYRGRGDKADYEAAGLSPLGRMNIRKLNLTKANTCLYIYPRFFRGSLRLVKIAAFCRTYFVTWRHAKTRDGLHS